jgi:surfeit locus 1 family protein
MNRAVLATRRPAPRWTAWLFFLLMLALTVFFLGLAKWQFERLHWKEGLIAQAEANMRLKPQPLLPVAQWPGVDPEVYAYSPVTATGHYLPAESVRVFVGLGDDDKPGRYSGPGYWIMTPFALDAGGTVFVDRGFVPQPLAAKYASGEGAPTGTVSISGATVASEAPSLFTPAPDAAHRIDWVRDTGRLSAFVPSSLRPIAPFYIDLPAGPAGSLPQGGETTVDYTNNHLGYALTWLGFALTTAIMLAEWVRRQQLERAKTRG